MPETGHVLRGWSDTGHARLPLPHGHDVPSHSHRQGHLVYPAAGVLSITTDDGTWIAPATRLAWTPGGFQHQHRAYGQTDMRVLFLSRARAVKLPERPAVFAVSPLVRELMLTLTADVDAARPPDVRDRLEAAVVDELTPVSEERLHLPEPHDDRLREISRILHADPSNAATLDELGRRVGASRRSLTRLFHTELGMSFRQWRTQLRLHYALTLLAAGQTVTSTAAACGWANPTSFIEAFSATLGQTPGHYQNGYLSRRETQHVGAGDSI